MNLLLLLSALFSALTGAGSVARRPDVAQAVAQVSVAVEAVRGAVAVVAQRPVQALATLGEVAFAAASPVQSLPAAPLWMDRRRE